MNKKILFEMYYLNNHEEFDEYIRYWIESFILKETTYERSLDSSNLIIKVDAISDLRLIILDDIMERFNAEEIYTVFNLRPYGEICPNELRSNAIDRINQEYSERWSEGQRLKRKVWAINPVYFMLMHQLIDESKVFYFSFKDKPA